MGHSWEVRCGSWGPILLEEEQLLGLKTHQCQRGDQLCPGLYTPHRGISGMQEHRAKLSVNMIIYDAFGKVEATI